MTSPGETNSFTAARERFPDAHQLHERRVYRMGWDDRDAQPVVVSAEQVEKAVGWPEARTWKDYEKAKDVLRRLGITVEPTP